MKQKRNIVWDIFTRVFHWSLLCLLVGCWWTAENGLMEWHFLSAYLLLSLLFCRLIWGFVGSDTSRFSQFVKSPKTVICYLRGNYSHHPGHNPAGGWMVLVMLSVIAFQLSTGLFASDDMFYEGPLVAFASGDTVSLLTSLHKLNFNFILALAGIHILAVVVYELKGNRLVKAMITGGKSEVEVKQRPGWLMLILAALLALLLIWVTGTDLPF